MRRHPELGARIIEPVPALDGARELVIACHEHWDGSGYPLGLAGEAIPLGARIILACDAFHAMTSDRVYRAALPDVRGAGRAATLRRHAVRSGGRRCTDRRAASPSRSCGLTAA